MTPADQLRTAAERLRALAEAATPGEWESFGLPSVATDYETDEAIHVEGVADTNTIADATFIAAMNPNVARLLADWLDLAAMRWRVGSDFPSEPLALAEYVNGRTA